MKVLKRCNILISAENQHNLIVPFHWVEILQYSQKQVFRLIIIAFFR